MRTIPVLIVDDNEDALRSSRLAMEQLVEPAYIFCARTAAETMRILSEQSVQLAFLDIDMPDTDGFSIAGYIDQHCPQVRYIFLTGHADLAARSYDYEPLDFLIKPVDVIRLNKALERYEDQGRPGRVEERVVLDTDEGLILLSPAEISYAAKELRQIKLHCLDGRAYTIRRTSLDEVEAFFSGYAFFRVHQSYLVPLENIAAIRPAKFGRAYEAVLNDRTVLPMSRARYLQMRSLLNSSGMQIL